VKLGSGDAEDNEAAIRVTKENTGILDVVIANAGKLIGGLRHFGNAATDSSL
jgi:hypothetical protein